MDLAYRLYQWHRVGLNVVALVALTAPPTTAFMRAGTMSQFKCISRISISADSAGDTLWAWHHHGDPSLPQYIRVYPMEKERR
ncbi:hypothetical protein LXA43DRAFT_1007983, partial [Ganoderma leucocontextum]